MPTLMKVSIASMGNCLTFSHNTYCFIQLYDDIKRKKALKINAFSSYS